MHRILFTLSDTCIAALLLLPVFFWLDRRFFHSKGKSTWYLILALYLSAVYTLVGLPDVLYIRLDLHVNLIPFAYMFSAYETSLLNVLLFVPLGFFLPVLCGSFRAFWRTALCGFGTSLAIELLQIFTYRATDINDLITNTLGAGLGWAMGRIYLKLDSRFPLEENSWNLGLTFAVTFGIMFFLHPLVETLVFKLLAI